MPEKDEGDIFQRIAKAVVDQSEPIQPEVSKLGSSDKVVGQLPLHLRHICLLLDELFNKIALSKNEDEFVQSVEVAINLRILLFDAIKKHYPESSTYCAFNIYEDWKIVGITESEANKLTFAFQRSASYEMDQGLFFANNKLH